MILDPPYHVLYKMFFTVFLERKSGITGLPFGRTELSIGGIGTTFHALLHRHGPVGTSFQGMPDEDGWISALRAVSDTK